MYFDGPLFIADEVLLAISLVSTFLTLACRQSKPRFGVTDQPAFWIPNGTAEFRVVRAIAPHPRLSQPGLANAQKIGRLLWSQHTVTAVRLPRRFENWLERRFRAGAARRIRGPVSHVVRSSVGMVYLGPCPSAPGARTSAQKRKNARGRAEVYRFKTRRRLRLRPRFVSDERPWHFAEFFVRRPSTASC